MSLTATKASPGGVIRPFWEPLTARSTFHASVLNGAAPRPLMVSTTNRAPVSATSRPKLSTSLTTPVDVSL